MERKADDPTFGKLSAHVLTRVGPNTTAKKPLLEMIQLGNMARTRRSTSEPIVRAKYERAERAAAKALNAENAEDEDMEEGDDDFVAEEEIGTRRRR